MYQYPYGNAQQLNLDWILSKLQELESGGGADLEEVANTLVSASFDATIPYRRYDYAFYDGKLYRALNDNIGAFNPADWIEVTLGADIPVLTRLVNADSALITTLQNQLQNLGSDEVANESTVTGATVSDALGNLNGAISSVSEKHEITLSNKVTTNITAFAVNGIGYINFGFNNQSIPTTAYWTTMATLESQYRPSAERYFDTLIIMDGVSEVHVGRITTSGNIDINHLSGTHTISSIRATIPYVI